MSVEILKAEILKLPAEESKSLWEWFADRRADAWDTQIEQDVSTGALDFLIEEAKSETKPRALSDLVAKK